VASSAGTAVLERCYGSNPWRPFTRPLH